MKKALYALCFLLPVLASAQKNIPVDPFTSIESTGAFTIILEKSETNSVTVSGDEKDMECVQADVRNNKLFISESKAKTKSCNVEIVVHYTTLNEIITTGTNNIVIKDSLVTGQLFIDQSGASKLNGKVIATDLKLDVSGASDVILSGKTENLTATTSGAATLDAGNLVAESVQINSSGASNTTVYANKKLNAETSGAANVQYKGSPADRTATVTGASNVYSIDEKTNIAPNGESRDNDQYNRKKKKFENDWKDRVENMGKKGRYSQDLVWMGIDLGVNGYVDNNFNFQPQGDYNFMELNYGRNANVRLNFFEWRFNLAKNVFNLVTGMGFEWYHYSFAQNIRLYEATDFPGQTFPTSLVGVQDTAHAISRSRLVVQSFCIPILFNLRTKKTARHRQQFNFSFGVVGSVRIGSNHRVTYSEEGSDVREKTYDDFNLSMFAATAMVRIKYSFFSMYISYTFTPMFQKDDPGLRPISLGVTLLSF